MDAGPLIWIQYLKEINLGVVRALIVRYSKIYNFRTDRQQYIYAASIAAPKDISRTKHGGVIRPERPPRVQNPRDSHPRSLQKGVVPRVHD